MLVVGPQDTHQPICSFGYVRVAIFVACCARRTRVLTLVSVPAFLSLIEHALLLIFGQRLDVPV